MILVLNVWNLGRFSLRFKNPDIFLANIVHGDIIVTSFIKHLFRDGPDFLVHLVIRLLKVGHLHEEHHFLDDDESHLA